MQKKSSEGSAVAGRFKGGGGLFIISRRFAVSYSSK